MVKEYKFPYFFKDHYGYFRVLLSLDGVMKLYENAAKEWIEYDIEAGDDEDYRTKVLVELKAKAEESNDPKDYLNLILEFAEYDEESFYGYYDAKVYG